MRTRTLRRCGVAILALLALALFGCLLLGGGVPQQVLLSYLAAYVFFLGLALGSVPVLMIHPLTGGAWGIELQAPLLAATRVLPLLAVMLVPILLFARWLYPWVHPEAVADPDIARQAWYLGLPFFIGRAVVCYMLWLGLAWGVQRRLRDPRRPALSIRFAAAGLIVYAVTVTVAGSDWIMSLVPAWHSSTLGLIIGTGQLLGAVALAVFCATGRAAAPLAPARLRDMGNLMLMLVLAWSYLVFMDYLTAWIADLPAETVWYLPRLQSGWRWLGVTLVLLHLLLPFTVLLSRRAKQQRAWMRGVAAVLLLSQAAYALWLVLPSFRPQGFALVWSDGLAWLGIGGLCWALFDLRLAQERIVMEGAP